MRLEKLARLVILHRNEATECDYDMGARDGREFAEAERRRTRDMRAVLEQVLHHVEAEEDGEPRIGHDPIGAVNWLLESIAPKIRGVLA